LIKIVVSEFKLNALGQRQGVRVVDGAGRAAHVLLPSVRARLATAACLFFASECTTDFGAGGSNVAVNNSAVASKRTNPLEIVLEVFGEEGRGEALWDFVVPSNRFVQGLEAEDVKDRCKDFMLNDVCIVGNLDDRGFNVVTLVTLDNLSSSEDLATLLLNFFKAILVLLDTHLRVQRSHQGFTVHGVADLHSLVGTYHAVHEVVVNAIVQEESAQGCAALATCSNSGEDRALECNFEVGIGHDDGCIIATKLKDGAAKSLVDISAHVATHGG